MLLKPFAVLFKVHLHTFPMVKWLCNKKMSFVDHVSFFKSETEYCIKKTSNYQENISMLKLLPTYKFLKFPQVYSFHLNHFAITQHIMALI